MTTKLKLMKLPCGCQMGKDGNTFYIRPHSKSCEYYLYAIEQSKKRGNVIVEKAEETG